MQVVDFPFAPVGGPERYQCSEQAMIEPLQMQV